MDDQSAALFEGGRMVETLGARPGASVWQVSREPAEGSEELIAVEERLPSRRLARSEPAAGAAGPDILELRATLAARAATRRAGRSGVVD